MKGLLKPLRVVHLVMHRCHKSKENENLQNEYIPNNSLLHQATQNKLLQTFNNSVSNKIATHHGRASINDRIPFEFICYN